MAQIAIIGAGMAGLAAAQRLTQHGHRVTVYEKSRGVGGRVATRRVDGCRFDHGAQYIKAPTLELQTLVHAIPGITNIGMPVWTFDEKNRLTPGDPVQNAEPKWVWPTGVNALGKALAEGVEIRFQMELQRIERHGTRYSLFANDNGQIGNADVVLITAPAPQTKQIIEASSIEPALQTTLAKELGHTTYRCCITMTLGYAIRPQTPWYALVNTDRRHPISWLACEHYKPGYAPTQVGLIVAQMSDKWSRTRWDVISKGTLLASEFPGTVHEVHSYVQQLLGSDPGTARWADVQRWRYALPDRGCNTAVLNSSRSGLYFAGDYVVGQGRAHLAIENGWEIAEQMIAELE
jgi:predicted NAD/FAD-dependent oxidoreductase